ncbi:hypothetical protein GWK47_026286 [Chionoecetes opilio]|uniref:Uncharacterized protein n=1 Tax=Chionoecetes opilio TaxID=41210 RepID=A0A8J8WAI0_CHIOP|nr:hypothetical protein GWK47_026286 [Chionoecetes opilio]
MEAQVDNPLTQAGISSSGTRIFPDGLPPPKTRHAPKSVLSHGQDAAGVTKRELVKHQAMMKVLRQERAWLPGVQHSLWDTIRGWKFLARSFYGTQRKKDSPFKVETLKACAMVFALDHQKKYAGGPGERDMEVAPAVQTNLKSTATGRFENAQKVLHYTPDQATNKNSVKGEGGQWALSEKPPFP